MIKLVNITTQKSDSAIRVEVAFLFQGEKSIIWFETGSDLTPSQDADAFLSFIILPAMFVGEDIDVSGFPVSEKLLQSLGQIQQLYLEWFGELNLKKVQVVNVSPKVLKSQNGFIATFFSGGVDSFDTAINSEKDANLAKIGKLIYVYGYDIRLGDEALFCDVKKHLDESAVQLNKDIIYISTNLREFTERLFSWDFIHGAALIAVTHAFNQCISTIYIPASNSIGQFTPNGSHPELDPLFASETLDIIHYGIERKRIDKIIMNIAHSPVALHNLRVCWKNSGGKINCGKCEKCVRTMIALEAAGVLSETHTFSDPLILELLNQIRIPNEGTANLYRELLPHLKGSDLMDKVKMKICALLEDFDDILKHKRMLDQEYTKSNGFVEKNKNILFLDFNGVLSYNPFWASLKNPEHKLSEYYGKIETYLFKDNISIVIDWMIGKYSAEEIHRILEKEVGVPYDELFPIFCEDCATIDISEKILEKIRILKSFYYCVLVTDNMDSFDRFTLTGNPQITESFDQIDNSYVMKTFKKSDNGNYFRDQVKKQGAIMENCILIDDSKNNCAMFESIGGKAFATKTEEEVLKTLDTIHALAKNKWEWQY